jgi:hypothetical protein
MQLHINAREHYNMSMEKAGVYGSNVEITAIKEAYILYLRTKSLNRWLL